MNLLLLRTVAVLVLPAVPLVAAAQASAAPALPATPLSATPLPATPSPPGPRLLTPSESRDSATPAGDLRPERRVTPQISVPLGRKPAPNAAADKSTAPSGAAASAIGTGAARCESLRGEQVRAKCRDQQAREGSGR